MPLIHCQNALCWLLSAWMLAGIGVPIAFEHSHVGGGDTHEHPADLHDHCDADCALHHHEHPDSPQPRCVHISSGALHSHLSLFGIEFHMPDSDAPSDDDSERSSPAESVVATLGQPFTLSIQRDGSGGQTIKTTTVAAGEAYVCVRQSIRTLAPVTFSHLCDSARRELTGVLRC